MRIQVHKAIELNNHRACTTEHRVDIHYQPLITQHSRRGVELGDNLGMGAERAIHLCVHVAIQSWVVLGCLSLKQQLGLPQSI